MSAQRLSVAVIGAGPWGGTLQAEILSLCAADLPPLDRANAIADLGELFLQALPSEDFEPHVTEIEARAAEVERQLDRE